MTSLSQEDRIKVDAYQKSPGKYPKPNIPNFRRQLTTTRNPLLVPVDGKYEEEGRGHAKAQLYRRKA